MLFIEENIYTTIIDHLIWICAQIPLYVLFMYFQNALDTVPCVTMPRSVMIVPKVTTLMMALDAQVSRHLLCIWNLFSFYEISRRFILGFKHYITECAPHCSLCWNATDCYECTQGFYLNDEAECERKCLLLTDYITKWILTNITCITFHFIRQLKQLTRGCTNILIVILECSKHCSLCYNDTSCYECTQGYFLNSEGQCESKLALLIIIKDLFLFKYIISIIIVIIIYTVKPMWC